MIFDRRRYYWIALALAAVIAAGVYFMTPRVTPQQRVREQVALLATEPWIRVRVDDVRYVGGSQPQEALLHGVRLDTGAPVAVDYRVSSPYTATGAMEQLVDEALPGKVAEVLMLPRPLAQEPYRSQIDPSATHVGVTLFVGLPEPVAEGDIPEVEKPAPADSGAAVPGMPAEPGTPPGAGSTPEPEAAPGNSAQSG